MGMLDSALSLAALLLIGAPAVRSDTANFDGVEPILMDLFYGCHGDGMGKGAFAMDKWDSVRAPQEFQHLLRDLEKFSQQLNAASE